MSKPMRNTAKGPIPPNTLRVSIKYGEWVYVVDYPADKIEPALVDFDDLAGRTIRSHRKLDTWKGDDIGARSLARYAKEEGEHYLLAMSALWMFVNRPDKAEQARAERLMSEFLKRDGSAWLVASTDAEGLKWSFSLFPASVARIGSRDGLPIFPALSNTFH